MYNLSKEELQAILRRVRFYFVKYDFFYNFRNAEYAEKETLKTIEGIIKLLVTREFWLARTFVDKLKKRYKPFYMKSIEVLMDTDILIAFKTEEKAIYKFNKNWNVRPKKYG